MNKQDLYGLGFICTIFYEGAPYWRVRLSEHEPDICVVGRALPIGPKGDGVFGFATRREAERFIVEVELAWGEPFVATCLLTHEGHFMTQAAFEENNRIANSHLPITKHGHACYILPVKAATAEEKRKWLFG